MCLMCLEFAKERMNFHEVRRAVGEMVFTAKTTEEKKHYETIGRMTEAELRETAAAFAEVEEEKNSRT